MKKVTCEFCGREISKCNYSKHIRRHENHPESFKEYNYKLTHDGLNCQFCDKVCKNKNSLCNHERLCKFNPNRQLTTYEKYGATKNFNLIGRRAWNKGLTKETDERVAKCGKTISEKTRLGLINCNHKGIKKSSQTKQKISSKMLQICKTRNSSLCGKGKRGYYKGFYCQSSWELAYVIYCLDNGINVERNKKGFPYVIDGVERTYFPDFYLPDIDMYVEIKGYYNEKSKLKVEQFAGNLVVMQLKEMEPILSYCHKRYGEDFINLYERI